MSTTHNKSAMTGSRRFQWQAGGWFGGVFGGSAWLIPTSVILALKDQPTLALVPAGCCLLMLVVGGALWYRRDRIRPFFALIGILALFSIVAPFAWFTVSANATPESLAAMKWPQQGISAAVITLICPVIIAWSILLEYTYSGTSDVTNRTN